MTPERLASRRSAGAADFVLLISPEGGKIEARRVAGDTGLEKIASDLRPEQFPLRLPAAVEVPLRGTLTCKATEETCELVVLDAEAARALSRKEASANSVTLAGNGAPDPHLYNSPAMGMRIWLADEWKLVKEERGSFSRPFSAMFGKEGSLALCLLTREHIEGSADLYQKMI